MNSTILVGIAALVLTVVFHQQAADLPDVAQRLPALLIWIVAALAVLMILEEILKLRRQKLRPATSQDLAEAPASTMTPSPSGTAAATAPNEDPPLPPIHWRVVIPFSLALAAYVWLISIVGYLLTTAVFMAAVLAFSRTVRIRTAVLVGLGMTAFIWVVFIWMLGLPVPLLPWTH